MSDDEEFEDRIRGFDKVKEEIGPLTVRYALHGPHLGREYLRMTKWTGSEGKGDPSGQLNKQITEVNELGELVCDYIREIVRGAHSWEKVTIISPPRSCAEDSKKCKPKKQRKHLGYKVGKKVVRKIDSTYFHPSVYLKHYLAVDLFHCNFPSFRGSWPDKAREKYCNWIPRSNYPVETRINNSDTIIIIDDTMVSYMGMIRISLAVREINPECRILWAAVFGMTDQRYRDHTPDKLLPLLRL